MAIIKKKILPQYFELIQSGKKKFEFRLADFDVQEGDTLLLQEWDRGTKQYTGRTLEKTVSYLSKFDFNNALYDKKDLEEKGFYIIQFE